METIPLTQHVKEQTDPQIVNTATDTAEHLLSPRTEKDANRSTIITTEEVSIVNSRKPMHPTCCPTVVLNSICPCCQECHQEEENVYCCHCNGGHVYLCPAEGLSRTVCVAEAAHNALYSSCPQSVINHTVTYAICQDSSTSTTDSVKLHNK